MTAEVEVVESAGLGESDRAQLQALWLAAFGDRFSAEDADHAFGGVHCLIREGSVIVAHASAVPRIIEVAGRSFGVGYVEAVATHPEQQGKGLGSAVMGALQREIRSRWELGVLSTGARAFYERLGWQPWRGPSFVITETGQVRTEDEDDGLMVLPFDASEGIDLDAPIACRDRPGDAW